VTAIAIALAAGACSSSGSSAARPRASSAIAPKSSTSTTTTLAPEPTVVTDAHQPPQPTSGPGGSDYPHADWRVSTGGSGVDQWYVFEPVAPQPKSAPVTIMMHGYYDYSGYNQLYGLIRHTVRKGSIVIYPRWQTGIATPCPGPIDIEPCLTSALTAIRGALAYLRADPSRVQPNVNEASYFGFSFGGIITVDLANRYRSLHLPKPRVIFLDDPHDGGLTGTDEPAVDHSLAGIPASTLLVCHTGQLGVTVDPRFKNASCNAIFPKFRQIPLKDKSLVLTHSDAHGKPALAAIHGVCMSYPGTADAFDWNFCWKTWDALRDCAFRHTHCDDALGDGKEHRDLGAWSDGVAIVPLEVQSHAPIRP
jgi:hypothetical protein